MLKNVVITGANGFVGSNTVKYFLEQGVNVLAVDICKEPTRLPSDSKLKYISMDVKCIDQMSDCAEREGFDAFIHFAWNGSAGEKRTDYVLQMTNALETVECVKFAKKIGCKTFIGAGSIMEKEAAIAVETQGTKPGMAYLYGMGKLIAHDMCKCVAADIGINFIWPMITNAYGAGEISPRFISTTIQKIIKREPLQFTSATQNYDFVYVSDVAKAFYMVAEYGKPFCEYIIGSGHARPLRKFIEEIICTLNPNTEALFGDVKFTGVNLPISAFDTKDIHNDTNFAPEISFQDGVKRTFSFLKEQM